MGAAQSTQRPQQPPSYQEKHQAQDDATLVRSLQDLVLSDKVPVSADGSLTMDELKDWADQAQDPKTSLARTILNHTDIPTALLSRSATVADAHCFNLKLDYQTNPVTNQKSSGRCWLFASTNVIRYDIAQKLNLDEFQLSQSYLFFYDKLEKSNYFLELSIEHADLPDDDRLITHLASDPITDGGQLDMAVNLLERYGVVPQPVYPESFSSSSSGRMDRLLTTKLREFSVSLRSLVASLQTSLAHLDEESRNKAILNAARKQKESYMKDVYRFLSITLGTPPSAHEPFTWEYYDSKGKFNSYTGTPVEFYQKFRSEKYPLTDSFSLVNDPRNPFETLFTVSKLGNVWGGKPVTYVNTESAKLKAAVITSIKAGQPVFFGCDVGQFSNSSLGIMDLDLFEYENAFGVKFGLTKAQRLQTGDSAMTHAMVITAVHLDSSGNPVRYRVENSWGPDAGEKGYFVMTDTWFDQFVYQVVIPRKLASVEHLKVLDGGNASVYPPWDPMGVLA